MRGRNRAFSLIELVIALAILAAVTTIAIRATNNLQDQARYQSTVRSLNEIQAAIVGPANPRGPNGSAIVSGFVADTGRLPEYYVSANDPLTQLTPPQPGDPLTELTYNPNSIPAYSLQSSNVDPSVNVGVGWQGPYVYLGAGPTYIRDGWGNSLLCYNGSGGQITTTGTPIAQVASTANGQTPVSIPNSTITTNNTGFASAATITGGVTMNIGLDPGPASSGYTPNLTFTGTPGSPITPPPTALASAPVSIWVAYFGPDLTQSPNLVGTDPMLVDYNNGGTWNTPWSGQFIISASSTPAYSNVTIGPRVLKVYLLPATVQTASQFNTYVSNAANPIYTTSTLNVTLVGGTQTINLVLPHYSP
jgi:prepilin-type N-terminal cleavage/methylation domain-containing protein